MCRNSTFQNASGITRCPGLDSPGVRPTSRPDSPEHSRQPPGAQSSLTAPPLPLRKEAVQNSEPLLLVKPAAEWGSPLPSSPVNFSLGRAEALVPSRQPFSTCGSSAPHSVLSPPPPWRKPRDTPPPGIPQSSQAPRADPCTPGPAAFPQASLPQQLGGGVSALHYVARPRSSASPSSARAGHRGPSGAGGVSPPSGHSDVLGWIMGRVPRMTAPGSQCTLPSYNTPQLSALKQHRFFWSEEQCRPGWPLPRCQRGYLPFPSLGGVCSRPAPVSTGHHVPSLQVPPPSSKPATWLQPWPSTVTASPHRTQGLR